MAPVALQSDVRIRAADPVTDRDAVLAVLARNMARQPAVRTSAQRYDWLYLSNPAGRAYVWLAEDAQTGTVVGTSAGVPKRVRVNGTVELALNLTDFAIDHPYRSLGPALRLLRSTLAPVDAGQFAFAYEQSVGSMVAVYTRLGVRPVGHKTVFVRPLGLTPLAERLVGRATLTRAIRRAEDVALTAASSLRRRRSSVPVDSLHEPCGRDFAALEERTSHMTRVRLVRSPDHLNWRMLGHPVFRHEVLRAHMMDRLAGYVVFRPAVAKGHRVLVLVDLMTLDDPVIARRLLSHLASIGRARGAAAITVRLLDGSPTVDAFRRLGFLKVPRWSRLKVGRQPTTVVYTPPGAASLADTLLDPKHWWSFQGDIE